MQTHGTEHMDSNEFGFAFNSAKPWAVIVYARGDVGYSRGKEKKGELNHVANMAWAKMENGEAFLFQRRTNIPFGLFESSSSFEYLAIKSNKAVVVSTSK